MGADLIIVALATPVHELDKYGWPTLDHLDWEAGERAIGALTIDERLRNTATDDWYIDEDLEEVEDFDEAIRNYLTRRLDELKEGLVGRGSRDVTSLRFGDHLIIICGGTSWGETPSDPFNAMSELLEVHDEVLAPIGFTWPGR